VSRIPRVTVVTSRLDVGGTERHLTRILPALRQRRVDIGLYVMERGGALEAGLSAQGVPIEGPGRCRFLHWPRATLQLARFLRRERPDIVHFFLPRPYIFGSIAAEIAGHDRRIMSRRSLTDYQARYPMAGFLERQLHKRTVALIGNSTAVVGQLAREVEEPQRLALIYNGIELPVSAALPERQESRAALALADGTLVIAVVANLIGYKGHGDLIEALAPIKDDLPMPWRLLVIGRDDGIGAGLKSQAEARGIAGNILWLGERLDVGALLAASDIFVLPSHQEGFSNALLEAMAASLPPIATAVGGNNDAVADDATGILTPASDPRALGAAILRLARNPGLRRRLGDAARQHVERRFSLDACVGRYEKMYRALIEPSPPPISQVLADDHAGPRAAEIELAH